MDNHDKVLIEVTPSAIRFWMDQMDAIVSFFEARDRMNSHVHMAEIRYSPITAVSMEMRDMLGALYDDAQKALARQ